jgi:hypothetical protein
MERADGGSDFRDVIEKTPESGPVFIPESSFKDALAPLAGLAIGEVSPALEIASNDILIAVKREKVEEKTAPFEEVSGDVKALLTEEKNREAQTNFFTGLRERTNIVIHDHDLFPKPEAKTEGSVAPGETRGDVKAPADGEEKK